MALVIIWNIKSYELTSDKCLIIKKTFRYEYVIILVFL